MIEFDEVRRDQRDELGVRDNKGFVGSRVDCEGSSDPRYCHGAAGYL